MFIWKSGETLGMEIIIKQESMLICKNVMEQFVARKLTSLRSYFSNFSLKYKSFSIYQDSTR